MRLIAMSHPMSHPMHLQQSLLYTHSFCVFKSFFSQILKDEGVHSIRPCGPRSSATRITAQHPTKSWRPNLSRYNQLPSASLPPLSFSFSIGPGGPVPDPPGAAPRRVELKPGNPLTGVGPLKKTKMRYGPYAVPSMNTKSVMGESGALWNCGVGNITKPAAEFVIVGLQAGLEYPVRSILIPTPNLLKSGQFGRLDTNWQGWPKRKYRYGDVAPSHGFCDQGTGEMGPNMLQSSRSRSPFRRWNISRSLGTWILLWERKDVYFDAGKERVCGWDCEESWISY